MDHLQALRLPSMANFNAGFMYCNQSSEKQCGGPSKQNYEQRLTKAIQLAGCALSSNGSGGTVHYKVHFVKNGGAWILFIFLGTYTRMFWTVESLFYNPVWHFIVGTWETVVYSHVLDLDR
ncbi:hypothetical protein F2Q70_00028633 [Brassica cretica]|uniref:Uncharacterized protein n=1 Tax=Brassica cretica TaxID=69181 RepID=A0A8S9LFR2_BRACR|nr:hypothetical protein F2Q70_00028633 [Brassica cretica]